MATTTRSTPTPPNGSETSSAPASSRPAMSTRDQSQMSPRTISEATASAISSPELAVGASPSVSPGGQMIDLFGQEVAPASRSAQPERARQPMTNITCGLRGFLSSPSAALQQSLESRLKRQLDGVGSTLFSLTWKTKGTPAGRPYCQLAASALRTSDSDSGSWPTPRAEDSESSGMRWSRGKADTLTAVSSLTSWAIPAARDYKSESATDEFNEQRWKHPRGKPLSAEATLAAWPTPKVATGDYQYGKDKEKILNLQGAAKLASWSPPRANKWGFPDAHGSQEAPVSGPTSNGFHAQTGKPGQLSPEHSRWLMGYSAEHLSCAPMETPSSLKSRRNSFQPSWRQDHDGR